MNIRNLQIEKLVSTISILRGKNGCPWDIKQTPKSLTKYLKEEVHELIQAIDNDDIENACEEIGDVLYVIIMISKCYEDNGMFDLNDSVDEITEKLIRRHPHVFEGKTISSDEELRQQWESIKKSEKRNSD